MSSCSHQTGQYLLPVDDREAVDMASSASVENGPGLPDSSDASAAHVALHVLSPSLPPPSRFTLNDLPRATTIAGLKTRISQSIPSRPSLENQRLIYRGRPLVNHHDTLEGILEPPGESEYTIHLVLPPAPAPPVSAAANAPADTQQPNAAPPTTLFNAERPAMSSVPQTAGMRFRGTVPATTGLSEVDLRLALRRNMEAFRRQAELQERNGSHTQPTSQSTATTTSSDPFASHVPSPLPQQAAWQRLSEGFSNPLISATPNHTSPLSAAPPTFLPPSMPSLTSTARSSMAESDVSDFTDSQQFRLQVLRHQVALGEDQLSRGLAPPFEHIVHMRTQLLQLLDEHYRNPLSRRDGTVEALLTRVFNMYNRADQLRVLQTRTSSNNSSNLATSVANAASSTAPLYLLYSQNGYEGVVAAPNAAGSTQASLAALRAAQTPRPTPTTPAAPSSPPNPPQVQPNPAVMENVVRQAVMNQRLHNNDNQLSLGRTIRRIWLFIRLYFFCYMFSEPGTWTRIFFVCVAVTIAVLSDTGIPQQLYRMIVAPIQQHMEGVIERPTANGEQQPAVNPTSHASRDSQRGPGPGPTGLRQAIRRAERSVLFFMASLIPGISEHYIAVTNDIDTRNAQRAREAEEEEANRRRQEDRPQEDRRQEEQEASHDGEHARDENLHAHPEQARPPTDEIGA